MIPCPHLHPTQALTKGGGQAQNSDPLPQNEPSTTLGGNGGYLEEGHSGHGGWGSNSRELSWGGQETGCVRNTCTLGPSSYTDLPLSHWTFPMKHKFEVIVRYFKTITSKHLTPSIGTLWVLSLGLCTHPTPMKSALAVGLEPRICQTALWPSPALEAPLWWEQLWITASLLWLPTPAVWPPVVCSHRVLPKNLPKSPARGDPPSSESEPEPLYPTCMGGGRVLDYWIGWNVKIS